MSISSFQLEIGYWELVTMATLATFENPTCAAALNYGIMPSSADRRAMVLKSAARIPARAGGTK